MGAVTSAAASPLTQAATPRSIAEVTAIAFVAAGLPGETLILCPVSMIALSGIATLIPARVAASRKTSPLPMSRNRRPSICPERADHALTATSGPMPAGSPWLMTMGRLEKRPSSCFDNGVAPQIAQIALGEERHLLHEKLLLHLI